MKKHGIAKMNLLIGAFVLVNHKMTKHKLRKPLHNLAPVFPWWDSVSLVFFIWAASTRRKNNNHRFVSVNSGTCWSKESGHNTQRLCFFLLKFCFSRVWTKLREQIIKWHKWTGREKYSKIQWPLLQGWLTEDTSFNCLFLSCQFCFNKTFHDLKAKGDWEGNILILMVVSIFFIQNDQKYFPRYNQIAFIHKSL